MKRLIALLTVAALMVVLTAMPASAQPVFTGGLVNVNISGNTVQVPIAAAANICNVSVASLQENPNCTADASSHANH